MSARTRANKRSKLAALEAARQLNEPGWSATRVARDAVTARDATHAALTSETGWYYCFETAGMLTEVEGTALRGSRSVLTQLCVHHGCLVTDRNLSVEDNTRRFLEAIRGQAIDLYRIAEVHVISPEMHAMVQAAAATLEGPDLTTLIRDDIPFEHGLLWLPEPLPLGATRPPAKALSWQLVHFTDQLPCLAVKAWGAGADEGPWPRGLVQVWAAPLFLAGGRADVDTGVDGAWTYPDHLGIAEYVFAYIRLSAQQILLTPRLRDHFNQADAKARQPEDVRITRLRSFKSAARRDGQPVPVNWTHRWTVRMHKTRQWYPSLGIHRVIFRGPFFKGPEGAPLLTGEKVHALVR